MEETILVFVHVFAAIILLGGVHYALAVVGPLARKRQDPELVAQSVRKFRVAVWLSAALLLITGLRQFMLAMKEELPAATTGMLHGKMGLAILVLLLATLPTLPMKALAGLARKPAPLYGATMLLGAVVIYLGVAISRAG